MKDITYDVRVYKLEVIPGKRGTLYRVRWRVGDKAWRRSFHTAAHADSFRSELYTATRKGEAFTLATGVPVSWARTKQAKVSWYDFVCQYVDMKWKAASAKYRRDIARAMVAATPPLIVGRPRRPTSRCARR